MCLNNLNMSNQSEKLAVATILDATLSTRKSPSERGVDDNTVTENFQWL